MSPKFLLFWTWCWVSGEFISIVIDGAQIGLTNSVINTLTGYNVSEIQGTANIWTVFNVFVSFFTVGIPNLLLWDFSFLQGDGFSIIRWFLVATLDPGLVYGLYLALKGIFSIK